MACSEEAICLEAMLGAGGTCCAEGTGCETVSLRRSHVLWIQHGSVAVVAANVHWPSSTDPTLWRSSPVCTLASW